jgi:hypothetical protein
MHRWHLAGSRHHGDTRTPLPAGYVRCTQCLAYTQGCVYIHTSSGKIRHMYTVCILQGGIQPAWQDTPCTHNGISQGGVSSAPAREQNNGNGNGNSGGGGGGRRSRSRSPRPQYNTNSGGDGGGGGWRDGGSGGNHSNSVRVWVVLVLLASQYTDYAAKVATVLSCSCAL